MKLKQIKEIIQGTWNRVFNITIEGEDKRLKICNYCTTNIKGICSKELGGCNCPIKSKVKSPSSRCPKFFW